MELQLSKKKIGLISAVGLGISSIIGSGWLFAPYKASAAAGPASIFAWLIAAFIISLLGLCFAEIASLYPRRGLSAIIPTLSHNKYFAFPFAIANWLGIVAVIALEADATIQYLINLAPTVEPILYRNGQLTLQGDAFSIILVALFGLINYWGASTLVKTNNIFVVLKVIIPIFIGIAMLVTIFHPGNFHFVKDTMVPYGIGSIFSAILSTGIIVAFNGFQTVISFSSEIKRPARTIPLAVIIAILLSLGVYLLLQIAFIGALPQNLLQSGWHQLQLHAPIVQLLGLMGLGMLSTVIYLGATISPCGSGIAFAGTSTRMFTAMSRNDQMPGFFNVVHPVYGISRRSLVLNTILAVVFLLIFRSWSSLAQVLSLFHIISYLPVPIALWVLRGKISKKKYSFRLPFGKIIALFVFSFFTYLFVLANISITYELMSIFGIFLSIFILVTCRTVQQFVDTLKQTWSLLLYFGILVFLTSISPAHTDYFTQLQFFEVVILTSFLLFIFLIKTERNDVEILESVVSGYRPELEGGVEVSGNSSAHDQLVRRPVPVA